MRTRAQEYVLQEANLRESESRPHGERDSGIAPAWEEVIGSKAFLKRKTPVTPELRVSMFPMDIDGTLHDNDTDMIELPDGPFASIVVSSCPAFTAPTIGADSTVAREAHVPVGTAANPAFPWLEVYSVTTKNSVKRVRPLPAPRRPRG